MNSLNISHCLKFTQIHFPEGSIKGLNFFFSFSFLFMFNFYVLLYGYDKITGDLAEVLFSLWSHSLKVMKLLLCYMITSLP